MQRRIFWIGAVLVLVADLVTKHLAFVHPATARVQGWPWIDGWLVLTRHYNRGIVFGLFPGHPIVHLAWFAAIIPILIVLAYACRAPSAPLWGLGLILGGAAGNLYDRIVYEGVRDFVQVDLGIWPANPWPVFNVADVAIVAGFAVYVGWSFLFVPPESDTGGKNPKPPADRDAED